MRVRFPIFLIAPLTRFVNPPRYGIIAKSTIHTDRQFGMLPTICLNNLNASIMRGYLNSANDIFDGQIPVHVLGSTRVEFTTANARHLTRKWFFVTIVMEHTAWLA